MKKAAPEEIPSERTQKLATIDVNKLNMLNPFDEATLKE